MRLNNLGDRHQLPLSLAIPYEMFIRAYQSPWAASVMRPFFPSRTPLSWIFVVGCYNSGTTVLKNAMALHPEISSAPVEGDRLTRSISSVESASWPRGMMGHSYRIWAERTRGGVNANRFISDLRPWIRGNKHFLEKSVSNSIRIPLLRQAFPGSRFICVMRNPEAVVRGIRKRSLPRGTARFILSQDDYPPDWLRLQWALIYGLILNDSQDDQDVFFVSYEGFLESPLTVLNDVFAFLRLSTEGLQTNGNELRWAGRKLKIIPGSSGAPNDGRLNGPQDLREEVTQIVSRLRP